MANTVLIVDDSELERTLIRHWLTKAGFEIVGEAENGEQAVEMYARLTPDCVTLDITMPFMDGLTAFELIRAEDPSAVILFTTAMYQRAIVSQVCNDSRVKMVAKPFLQHELVSAVHAVLRAPQGPGRSGF